MKHNNELHLVCGWLATQTPLSTLSASDQAMYTALHRQGKMLEPKYMVPLTGLQLELVNQSLEVVLTDGIIGELMLKYKNKSLLLELHEAERRVLDNFTKYPASYTITVVNQAPSISRKVFREVHNLNGTIAVQKSHDRYHKGMFCFYVTTLSVAEYSLLEAYFI